MILELRARTRAGIIAVPYRGIGLRKALRLPDGAIVEDAFPDQEADTLRRPSEAIGIGPGGVPATIHHANLGLVAGYLPLAGVYLLPSGTVAAVYGADVAQIGGDDDMAW